MKHQTSLVFLAGIFIAAVKCDKLEIEPLCENKVDMESCVREYFSKNGVCTVVTEQTRKLYKPMIIKGCDHNEIPSSNMTLKLDHAIYSHFDGPLETFHKNKKTQELVMSIHLKAVHIDVNNGVLYISRRSEVPQRIEVSAYGTHNVVITAVLPINQQITLRVLRKAMITAYFPESYAKDIQFNLKNPADASNPKIMASLQDLKTQEPTTIKELFVTGARYMFREYLEKHICMFGNPYEEDQ